MRHGWIFAAALRGFLTYNVYIDLDPRLVILQDIISVQQESFVRILVFCRFLH